MKVLFYWTRTGNPKGIMHTNQGVLHNLELTKRTIQANDQMIEFSFLPHHHNFGLFCSYLQTLYCGATGYFASPTSFTENPGFWISCLSKYKATHSQAPNFVFEAVLRKGYPSAVDLRSVKCLTYRSEPVCPGTIVQFESVMVSLGLPKNTVRVVYGLAEHTGLVCGVTNKEDSVVVNGRVSCGRPAPDVDVKVVDVKTNMELEEEEEGEIWVDSASKASGYWKRAVETQTTFKAALNSSPGRTYLRTGERKCLYVPYSF